MAAPYFGEALARAPLIGAFGFGFIFLMVLVDRTRQLADRAPKAKAPEPMAAAAVAADKAKAKVDHDKLWESAADAVPQGTVPKEGGFVPPFQPDTEGPPPIPGPTEVQPDHEVRPTSAKQAAFEREISRGDFDPDTQPAP